MSDFLIDEELLAAIDMGSNSFHLAIARVDHGEVKKVASMSEKVQLAAGLDENKNLTEAAQQRGLACLARFVGRLSSVQPNRLRIVATNALRQAKNGHEFIQKAAEILPKPIEIIAGREEARLIYLGFPIPWPMVDVVWWSILVVVQLSLSSVRNLNRYILSPCKWAVWHIAKPTSLMVRFQPKLLTRQ